MIATDQRTWAVERAVKELSDQRFEDPESAHLAADEVLLTLIEDLVSADDAKRVREGFKVIEKWYS